MYVLVLIESIISNQELLRDVAKHLQSWQSNLSWPDLLVRNLLAVL